ncbi:MAG: hypothetical protein ABJG88_11205 [Litorimonas sp.]
MSDTEKTQKFNEHEKEVIILNAVCSLLDEMNNRFLFTLSANSNIFFHTTAHGKLFNIMLVDFLSKVHATKEGLPFGLKKPDTDNPHQARHSTYLFYLLEIIESPKLGGDVTDLKEACENFSKWLEGSFILENVWFPSIELEITMKVRRLDALKHTGNIAKHNFTRLERTVKSIRKLLIDNNASPQPTLEECYQILPEFQEWFHDHAFVALSSSISEQLNHIRWAIHIFLQAEYNRAFEKLPSVVPEMKNYRFNIPSEISHPFAKSSYYDLMNLIRKSPILPRYTLPSSFHNLLS